jgi:hypothetical protein
MESYLVHTIIFKPLSPSSHITIATSAWSMCSTSSWWLHQGLFGFRTWLMVKSTTPMVREEKVLIRTVFLSERSQIWKLTRGSDFVVRLGRRNSPSPSPRPSRFLSPSEMAANGPPAIKAPRNHSLTGKVPTKRTDTGYSQSRQSEDERQKGVARIPARSGRAPDSSCTWRSHPWHIDQGLGFGVAGTATSARLV